MNLNKNNLFQIGELSNKAEVSKRTIRYYEEIGLLSPERVSSGGFRLYSVNELQRLKIIKQFKELDFSLEQIKEILQSDSNQEKEEKINYSRQVIETQLVAIQKQIDKLKKAKGKNHKMLDMLNQCLVCENETCPQGCPNREVHL